MIEILNETFPEEISLNILKFMTHPTADIIKPEIAKIQNDDYEKDEQPLHMFVYQLYCSWDSYKRCDGCHKFLIHPEKYNDYNYNESPTRYCLKCWFVADLKNKFKRWNRNNQWRIKNGEKPFDIFRI